MSTMTRAAFSKTLGMSTNPKKIGKVLHEFKSRTLHSGSKKGPKVKSRKQAVAIAMSEAGMSRKNKVHKPHGSPYVMGIHPDCVSHMKSGS